MINRYDTRFSQTDIAPYVSPQDALYELATCLSLSASYLTPLFMSYCLCLSFV